MAQYSHTYDAGYDPAMPVVQVVVEDPFTGNRSEPMTAIVDSGADGCLVPLAILRTLNLQTIRRATMRGVSGIGLSVELFLVTLQIGVITVKGVRVIGDRRGSELIIGRNVLNQLIVTLNGLAGEVELSE